MVTRKNTSICVQSPLHLFLLSFSHILPPPADPTGPHHVAQAGLSCTMELSRSGASTWQVDVFRRTCIRAQIRARNRLLITDIFDGATPGDSVD